VLEAALQTAKMREAGLPAQPLMHSNFRDSYWTMAQLVAHHTVTGCNLQAGDLLGSGTQSGPDAGQGGSMLELTLGGKQPLRLPNGETRGFLEDGDTVILRGRCERSGWCCPRAGSVSACDLPVRRPCAPMIFHGSNYRAGKLREPALYRCIAGGASRCRRCIVLDGRRALHTFYPASFTHLTLLGRYPLSQAGAFSFAVYYEPLVTNRVGIHFKDSRRHLFADSC